jgi:Transposase DDE domain
MARRPTVAQHIFPEVQVQAKAFREAEVLPYHDLIDGEVVRSALEEENLRFRVRIYTPVVTLWTFLTQVLDTDHSCRKAVRRLIAFLVCEGQPAVSADTSNYCKARQRLPLSFIARLVRKLGHAIRTKAPARWLWKGRPVFIVDATTASMPDTAANQRVYPQLRSQKPGLGFPLARIVAIIDLAVGVVLDVAIGPCKGKQTGEMSLWSTLWDRLQAGCILLGDRAFGSYCGIAELRRRNIDGVFRMHQVRKVDFRKGRILGIEDHVVLWRKPETRPVWMDKATYKQVPETMLVREVRFRVHQKGYRVDKIVLVTTLLDPVEYTKEELAKLYLERWHIEICQFDYRSSIELYLERLAA